MIFKAKAVTPKRRLIVDRFSFTEYDSQGHETTGCNASLTFVSYKAARVSWPEERSS